MTQYLMGQGHDLALDALSAFVPQPRSTSGVQAAQRDFGADGTVFEQGLFITLEWTSLGSVTKLQTLYAQIGIDDALRQAITLYAPNFEREWHRYNGYAIRPASLNYATFVRGLRVIVRDLERID